MACITAVIISLFLGDILAGGFLFIGIGFMGLVTAVFSVFFASLGLTSFYYPVDRLSWKKKALISSIFLLVEVALTVFFATSNGSPSLDIDPGTAPIILVVGTVARIAIKDPKPANCWYPQVTWGEEIPGIAFDADDWEFYGTPTTSVNKAKHYHLSLWCNRFVELPFHPVPFIHVCAANATFCEFSPADPMSPSPTFWTWFGDWKYRTATLLALLAIGTFSTLGLLLFSSRKSSAPQTSPNIQGESQSLIESATA